MKTLKYFCLFAVLTQTILAKESTPAAAAVGILDNLKGHLSSNQKKADSKYNISAFCDIDEEQFLLIEHSIVKPLKESLYKNSFQNISKILGPKFTSISFPIKQGAITRDFPEESMTEFAIDRTKKSSTAIEFETQYKEFFKSVTTLDYVGLDVIQVYANKSMRSKDFKNLNQAELVARFDLRLVDTNKNKIHYRGKFKLLVSKQKNGWKLNGIELIDGTSLVAYGKSPLFKEITENIAPQVSPYLRREAIRRGGYGTALGDYNGDGKTDLLVASTAKVQLFKGKGNGEFEEDKDSGLEQHTLVKSAAFVDLFNTGKQDIILVRFAPENDNSVERKRSDLVVYKNEGSKFKKIENAIFFKNNHHYAMPLAIGDLNKDGLLDLFVGFPGAKDFTFMKEPEPLGKEKLLSHGFFINEGKKSYAFYEKNVEELWKPDVLKNTIHSKVEWFTDPQYYYPHSAVAVDYNLDNNMDIVVIDDRTRLSPVYQGVNGGGFIKSNDSINFRVHDYGMGVAYGDLFGNNKMDFVMTAVNFAANERLNNSCDLNWDLDYAPQGSRGIRVYKNEGQSYSEVSKSYGLDFAGYGLSGVELFDYNNDGNLDIFIANGLWSGTEDDSDLDISSLLARAANMTLFEMDLYPNNKFEPRFKNPVGHVNISNAIEDYAWLFLHFSSQSSVMKILVDGKTKDNKRYNFAGFQKKRVFRNNGDGTFTEVGYGLGLDNMSDGYMMAFADLNNDGHLDLIQRNSDPGVKTTQYPPLQVFMNNYTKGNSLVLKLVGGEDSNKDAIGAVVTADVGKKKILRQLTAMNGTIQSEKIIHIGMGNSITAKNVEIKWPNGQIQKIENLRHGYHIINQQEINVSKN